MSQTLGTPPFYLNLLSICLALFSLFGVCLVFFLKVLFWGFVSSVGGDWFGVCLLICFGS